MRSSQLLPGRCLLCLLFLGAACLPAAPAGRPERHPDFEVGFLAFDDDHWLMAAEKMRAAEVRWAEDGISTRITDRWFEPYAPTYFLGRALAKLGCREQALAALRRSAICQREIRGRGAERAACQGLIETLRVAPPAPPAPGVDCSRRGRQR